MYLNANQVTGLGIQGSLYETFMFDGFEYQVIAQVGDGVTVRAV